MEYPMMNQHQIARTVKRGINCKKKYHPSGRSRILIIDMNGFFCTLLGVRVA